jgi:integrase
MQRFSVKLLLKKNKKNKLGQYPIYIRTVIDRKSTFISTSHLVVPSQWDAKNERVKESHFNHSEINTDILQKKKEILQSLVNASVKGQIVSADNIKEQSSVKLHNIFNFYEEYITELKGKRSPETLRNYEYVLLLKEFHSSNDLSFEQITPQFLVRFEKWLRNGGIKSENPHNTIVLIWSILRRLFNAARRKEIITYYPFDKYENPKTVKEKIKEHLTDEEIKKWLDYAKICKKANKQAAWYFLYGCFTGLRVSDWYKFDYKKQVLGNDLVLRATKNKGLVVIPIHSRLREVLNEIKKIKLTLHNHNIGEGIKRVAKKLEIEKNISSHSARHTFAVTMCLNKGISSETAAYLMAITLKTFVENYSIVTSFKVRMETEKAWIE